MAGLLGYALEGAGENIGNAITKYGFDEMKSIVEKERQEALLELQNKYRMGELEKQQQLNVDTKRQELAMNQEALNKNREEAAKRIEEKAQGLISSGMTPNEARIRAGFITGDSDIASKEGTFHVGMKNAESKEELNKIKEQLADWKTTMAGSSGRAGKDGEEAVQKRWQHLADRAHFEPPSVLKQTNPDMKSDPAASSIYRNALVQMRSANLDPDQSSAIVERVILQAQNMAAQQVAKNPNMDYSAALEDSAKSLFGQLRKTKPGVQAVTEAKPTSKIEQAKNAPAAVAEPAKERQYTNEDYEDSAQSYLSSLSQLEELRRDNRKEDKSDISSLERKIAAFEKNNWTIETANKVMQNAQLRKKKTDSQRLRDMQSSDNRFF